MKNLEMISLPSNKISYLNPLSNCKNLREINLRNNSIFSFDELYYLANLKKLKILCLEGNPISYDDNYAELSSCEEGTFTFPQTLKTTDNDSYNNSNNMTFQNVATKKVKVSANTRTIGSYAFAENANLESIYGYKNLDYDYVVSHGMAGYAHDMSKATRAGSKPLIVKAQSMVGQGVNPVLSMRDADKVLLENQATHFLDKTNVVFLY